MPTLVVFVKPGEAPTPQQRRDEARHVAAAGDRLERHVDESSVRTCVAAWLAQLLPTARVVVHAVEAPPARLPRDDAVVVCLGDAATGVVDPTERAQLLQRLRRHPRVLPPMPLQDLVADKARYYALLAAAGVPVARSRRVRVRDLLQAPQRTADAITAEFGGETVLAKPHGGGASRGVRVLRRYAQAARWRRLGEAWARLGYTEGVVQEFVEDFRERFEVRTYWFDGAYAYSMATKADVKEGGDARLLYTVARLRSEGGRLGDDQLKAHLLALGARVHAALAAHAPPPAGAAAHAFVRIDFGCCLPRCERRFSADACARKVFVNEIEVVADLFSGDVQKRGLDPAEAQARSLARQVRLLLAR
jgi:hypothetical protein